MMHGTIISKIRVTLSDGSKVFDVLMSRPGAEVSRFNCPSEDNADAFARGFLSLLTAYTLDSPQYGADRNEVQ
jgi:hypothetical protein